MPVKPRIPIYPRPVSPICAEEIPICNNTIVYHDQEKVVIRNYEGRIFEYPENGAPVEKTPAKAAPVEAEAACCGSCSS